MLTNLRAGWPSHVSRLPGGTPQSETCLEPGHLITAVTLTAPNGTRQIYGKVRERASDAFALISVGAAATVTDGRIAHAAPAFGGVATMPRLDVEVDAVLEG